MRQAMSECPRVQSDQDFEIHSGLAAGNEGQQGFENVDIASIS